MEGDAGPRRGDELEGGLADPRAPWEELVEDPSAPRVLLAIMFTDIVGSTELATSLGDKRWRELLEQHDAAIRAQLARFGGREVDSPAGPATTRRRQLRPALADLQADDRPAPRRDGDLRGDLSHFCSPQIDVLTERALATQNEGPSVARDRWAEVDRALTDAAPIIAWGNLRNAAFVSRRVGNVQGRPSYILLLSQMWVTETR